jgi:hypothetical protein
VERRGKLGSRKAVSHIGRKTCFSQLAMYIDLQRHDAENRRLINALRKALDSNYSRLRETARQQWERNFSGKDPSDACVSVRVTSGDSQRPSLPCAGILRRRRKSLLNGNGRPSLA